MIYGESIPLWDTVPDLDGVELEEIPVLDCYPAVSRGEKRGAVVVFPGGGYCRRVPHEGQSIAGWLNGMGLHAFVCQYRVDPHRYPSALADAQRAIRIVRSMSKALDIKKDKVGIIGFSAGGHLAANLATMYNEKVYENTDKMDKLDARPDACVLGYAVATFKQYGHEASRDNLLGKDADQEIIDKLSPEKCITKDTPPCFIWSTADDPVVPVQNSLDFAHGLATNNVDFEMHIYQNGAHGLGLTKPDNKEVCREWAFACEKWLFKQGF